MYYLESKKDFVEVNAPNDIEAAVKSFRIALKDKKFKGKSTLFEDQGGTHHFLAEFNVTRGKITVIHD